MQNELASLASQTATPRSSSERPTRPSRWASAHCFAVSGDASKSFVILSDRRNQSMPAIHMFGANEDGEVSTHVVSIAPGLIEFTRIPCGPSSHAMVRAIWSTADLEVLYDSHS